jgi:RNA 3'-terminal phosphate cyclase (ATP)
MSPPPDKKIIRIDGSYGEGGGQILRTSLMLSCVLGRQVDIINIRRERRNPGLQPQHLTAVKAAATISHAHVQGAELSSTALHFSPGAIVGGDYFFDVSEKKGSAGSTSLVLQTVLLPLCFTGHPSTVTVIGGTHVPWSPSFHYLKKVFLPMLSVIGVSTDLALEKWGWYPIGGGKVIARIIPGKEFKPVAISDRGKPIRVAGISAISNLPRDIGVRQRDRALKMLSQRGIDADLDILDAPSSGKGTLIFLLAEFENISAGFDALGAIGKRAEEVADEACRSFFEYKDTNGVLDPHLADQIVPYAAFCKGTSEFTTSCVTQHLLTNSWVIKQFLDIDILVEGKEGEAGKIRVQGHGTKGKSLFQDEGEARRRS